MDEQKPHRTTKIQRAKTKLKQTVPLDTLSIHGGSTESFIIKLDKNKTQIYTLCKFAIWI